MNTHYNIMNPLEAAREHDQYKYKGVQHVHMTGVLNTARWSVK